MSYNTKQKDIILKAIKKKKKEFTIKEIYDEIKGIVGLTTIYRLIDRLVDEEIITRFIEKDNNTYYRYLEDCDCDNHFYLKCDECGNIEHIDCDCINELSEHIFKKHNFTANKKKIFINGICKKCGNNEK